MSSTYLILPVVLAADWDGIFVSPEGAGPHDEETRVPLDRFCAEEGVEFIGWHPVYTLMGIFRKPSDQERARAAILDEALTQWARPEMLTFPADAPKQQRSFWTWFAGRLSP